MSAVPTIQWSLGIFVVLFVLNVFFQSNVRTFIVSHQWDSILTRSIEHLQEKRIFWFLFGALSGAWIISVTLPYMTATNQLYVNPIHDSRVKWNIVKWFSGIDIEPLSNVKLEPCHIVIVRLPDAYAEDFARDWKEIFGAIRWPVTEKLADTPIAKCVILRPIQAESKAVACANALNTTLSQYALSKRGDPLGSETHIYPYSSPDVATYHPKECVSPCVEVDIGNPRAGQQ